MVPGFLCVVSPRSIPSRASARTSHRFHHVLTSANRRQEAAPAYALPADSPTDCPVVYESVLVRERLLPLVFAVSQTGKVCENNAMTQHYSCFLSPATPIQVLYKLFFCCHITHSCLVLCVCRFRFKDSEPFIQVFTSN